MFEFVLPVSGKKITWKPLTVGEQVDLGAVYQGQQSVYLAPAAQAKRIRTYGDKTGCDLSEIKTWDEIDYDAFWQEVQEVELQRALKFKKPPTKPEAVLASQKLQKAVSDAREAMLTAMKEMENALQMAKAAESGVPLAQQTS